VGMMGTSARHVIVSSGYGIQGVRVDPSRRRHIMSILRTAPEVEPDSHGNPYHQITGMPIPRHTDGDGLDR